jgi:hypothetical protein
MAIPSALEGFECILTEWLPQIQPDDIGAERAFKGDHFNRFSRHKDSLLG